MAFLLKYMTFFLLPSGLLCKCADPTLMGGLRGGENNVVIDRRWEALMNSCQGSWSGTIGWFDAKIANKDRSDLDAATSEGQSSAKVKFIPRVENHKQNMRLSFYPRSSNPNIADWIVYHASAKDERQESTLYKNTEDDPNANFGPKQTFYCFQDGNLGRSGSDFSKLPVIEHGYWDSKEGMRRTVVLVYDKENGYISRICFLQQKRQMNEDEFDVAGFDGDDCSVMPQKAQSFEELRAVWFGLCRGTGEILDATTGKYIDIAGDETDTNACSKVLEQLLGKNSSPDSFQVALPNGIVLVCPYCLETGENFEILMGYKRQCGEIQTTQYSFDACRVLKTVTARCITNNLQTTSDVL